MAGGVPRSARYVDRASRQAAEDLARRSGLSLNEWVSQLMAEGPEDAVSQDYFSQPAPAYMEQPRYEPRPAYAPQPRYETLGHPADEVSRVAVAIERLSDRIESAESRQALAIAGIERSVREVIGRIDAAEREQTQVGARFEGGLQEIRSETQGLSTRVRRIEDEAAGPRSVEAMRALEGAVAKVAGHVYETEQRSRDAISDLTGRVARLDAADQATLGAIRELKHSAAALDQRLVLTERGAEQGIERAAEALSERVAATRDELSRELAALADQRFDRVDQALAKMTEHVAAAEQRNAGAMERMGREVIQVARTLNGRVQAVERASAEAAGKVSADVSRIAGAVEARLTRADATQAQALEKLGGEIARITERLADRIANAERRSAQAIDDVGEQVSRISERLTQRNERSVGELTDRIRQSEERTARLLEDARQKLDDRMVETGKRLGDTPRAAAPAASSFAAPHDDPFADAELPANEPFPGFETPPAERPAAALSPFSAAHDDEDEETFDDADFEAADKIEAGPQPFPTVRSRFEVDPPPAQVAAAPEPRLAAPPPARAPLGSNDVHDVFEAADLEPNVGFDVDDELVGPGVQPGGPFAVQAPAASSFGPTTSHASGFSTALPPAEAAPALSTRDVIERARHAARAAGVRGDMAKARAAARPADEGVLQNLSFGRARKRQAGPSGALMVASLMAAIGLSAGGYVVLGGKTDGKPAKQDALAVVTDPPNTGAAPIAAVAMTTQAPTALPPQPDLAGPYKAAIAKIVAGNVGGVADLRKIADAGYAKAEYYLADLTQYGKHGVKKDPTAARHWLERAAEGGDRDAMYNLALDEHEGIGGAKNAAAAVEWFRRAAELGLTDSQFNVAALYERGDGVEANAAEAYKWYLIAAKAGDAESKAGAARVRAGLSAEARSVAERSAAEFHPTTPAAALSSSGPTITAASTAQPDVATAQKALNQLGYYQGPTDGQPSPALHLALAAYQRDQSLPVTGTPDAGTIQKLQVYTR